jgi:hypothetical protein
VPVPPGRRVFEFSLDRQDRQKFLSRGFLSNF